MQKPAYDSTMSCYTIIKTKPQGFKFALAPHCFYGFFFSYRRQHPTQNLKARLDGRHSERYSEKKLLGLLRK